jgi:5'(3')-deoxyribonucleotidase
MKKLVALFDMDDTLCDTTSQKIREVEKYLPNEKNFSVNYCSPECTLQIRNLLRDTMSQPGWWQNLQKCEDGFELYELAKQEGYETQIISKAPETYPLAWTEKFLWCKKNTPGSKITLTLDKSRYDGEILIDDWTPYVSAWLERHPSGRAILPERAWNLEYLHKRAIKYNRQNTEEVRDLLRKIKEDKAKL